MTIQEKLFEDLKRVVVGMNGYPMFTVFMTEKRMPNNNIDVTFRFVEAAQMNKNIMYKAKVLELLQQWIDQNKMKLLTEFDKKS
jgi:hypothetical protein